MTRTVAEKEAKAAKDEVKETALAKADEMADALADPKPDELVVLEGLTDRQQTIVKLKVRGMTQSAIAQLLSITPARVSQEMRVVRHHFAIKGSEIDESAVVGESLTIYEEVEKRAWEVFHTDGGKKLRALDSVMTAREKQVKLLMDLGLLKRAATSHEHTVSVSPLIKKLSPIQKQEIAARIINTTQLTAGVEPEPPQILEGDYNEVTDDNEKRDESTDREGRPETYEREED